MEKLENVVIAYFDAEYFRQAYEFISKANIHDYRETMKALGHKESFINASIRRLKKMGLIK